jgi:hypothetical protein
MVRRLTGRECHLPESAPDAQCRSREGWRVSGLRLSSVSWLIRTLAAAVLVTTMALACAASSARASTPVPGDLATLEQQMAGLQVNSERFDFQEEIALSGFLGGEIPLALIVAGDGEVSDSPPQASVVSGLFGIPEEQDRLVGNTVYRYRHQAAEIDGGRPWVRSPRPASKESALDPGGVLEGDMSGAQGTFSKLVETLNGSLAIEEVGPVTVDDQRVDEFDAKLDPTPLLAQLKAQAKQPEHPLGSLLETSPVSAPKAPSKPIPPPTLELEVFIAPNGLPVRIRATFAAEGTQVSLRVDTLAVNIPVSVAPPPPRETIDEAQLKAIERRRASRERAAALRACRHLHGKRASRCRTLARSQGRIRSSEPSLF